MQLPDLSSKRRRNEECFFAYYDRLLEWAFQLTGNNRAAAEDLVHDLYFQLIRVAHPLEEVADNIEAYLFSMLRNLHYASLRRSGREAMDNLTIIDYDSLEVGLASVDRRELFFVRSDLTQICRFACQRKAASRSASVFILRFFFGYFPSEVMKITRMSRMSVDRCLQIARQEARMHLQRPAQIRCILQEKQGQITDRSGERRDEYGSESLFDHLREVVFSSCEGECFGPDALKQRFALESPDEFTTPELAHLVSCAQCLDQANVLLGLKPLRERSPEDALDRDTPSGGPPAPAAPKGPMKIVRKRTAPGANAARREKLERRMRQLFEHRPASLHIAVDGETRCSQVVTAEVSDLYLKLGRSEVPSSLEVLSEQGFRLLFLQVTEPKLSSALNQALEVALSHDRSLALALSFSTNPPVVHVVYRDLMGPASATESRILEDWIEPQNLSTRPSTPIGPDPVRHTSSSAASAQRFTPGRMTRLRSKVANWLVPEINPWLISGAILAAAFLACCAVWLLGPRMTPAALLQRATVSENIAAGGIPGFIHQRVVVRNRGNSFERSLYRDPAGRRRPRRQAGDPRTTPMEAKLAANGVAWDQPLSAAAYASWHNHARIQSDVVQRAGDGLLKLTTTVEGSAVSRESLTVRASDFHPVQRTISFRDSDTIEIAELHYEVLPWSSLDPAHFEPVLPPDAPSSTGTPTMHAAIPHSAMPRLTEAQLDEAELDALLTLRGLRADEDGRIQIVRRAGSLQVNGVVESGDRKREIESALNRVPHVVPALSTYMELQQSRQAATEISSLAISSAVAGPSPLEGFLTARGKTKDTLSRMSSGLSDASGKIRQDSESIAVLSKRFTNDSSLSDSARSSFHELIAGRQLEIADALDAEDRLLVELDPGPAPGNLTLPQAMTLQDAAIRNRQLCEELVLSTARTPRIAEQILPELRQAVSVLRLAVAATLPHLSPGNK